MVAAHLQLVIINIIITIIIVCAGIELSADPSRGALSPYVSAGFVWAVRQSVYASNRSHDVTNSSLGSAINDVCHFLLSKVSPIAGSHLYGVFGMYVLSSSTWN